MKALFILGAILVAVGIFGCVCAPDTRVMIQGETMDYWRGVGDGSKIAYDAMMEVLKK